MATSSIREMRVTARPVSVIKKSNQLCTVCFASTTASYNFGGMACHGCTAFFRRMVRKNAVLTCSNNASACKDTAIADVTALHACKKCRYERCLAVGMTPAAVQPPQLMTSAKTDDLDLGNDGSDLSWALRSMISSVSPKLKYEFDQLQKFYSQRASLERSGDCGIEKYFSSLEFFQRRYSELPLFRKLFDELPILTVFAVKIKNRMCLNALDSYVFFLYNVSYAKEIFSGIDKSNFSKLYSTRGKHLKYRMIENTIQDFLESVKSALSTDADELCKTEEDLVVFVLIIILHKNVQNSTCAEWRPSLDRLTQIFTGVDLYYRNNGRDPSTWANLFFFVTEWEALGKEYYRVVELFSKYMKR